MSQSDSNPLDPSALLEPLPGHSSLGRLERILRRGEFAVTAELNPPDSANPHDVYERAAIFDGWVDGINAVDASGANAHMSSVGICALLTRMGYAPIMQISCRDKNRIAIQGDVLGASAMGVQNILCLTGDGVQAGDQPGAKPVFDLDCMSLLETIRIMRDNSKFLSGRKLTSPPTVFLGAAINPFAPPHDFRPHRLAKKIAAGAQFVQSQYCYDVPDVQKIHAAGARHGPRQGVLHHVRCRPAGLGAHSQMDALQRARRAYSRRGHQAPGRAEDQKKEGKRSASTSSTRSRRSKASPAFM
jgi:5,10-methylenetetrahydrofolate reductase